MRIVRVADDVVPSPIEGTAAARVPGRHRGRG
jgi:hypothetical protein